VSDAITADFPFVQELPKREKSKLASVWEQFQAFQKAVAEHGALLPQGFAAELLGVSPQRVNQLIELGRLQVVSVHTSRLVTESSLIELAKTERKAGRPFKVPQTTKEVWAASRRSLSAKK